jgi:uncharacterized membrane protein YgdD (TMEM256/DUF423 family)
MRRVIGVAAATFGATAVALGAFGAHELQGSLDETALRIWHTAVEYQFWQALALLAIAVSASAAPARLWLASAVALGCGMALFCGSLYALALGAPHWLGAITPLGGAALILGWLLLGAAFWCSAASQ